MDNNDQRNGGVPRGTFNPESGADPADLTHSEHDQEGGSSEHAPGVAGFEHAPKERKRVRTLLGVPLADALAARTAPDPEISETIQHLLDEQSAIPIEIEDDEPTTLLDSEIIELPDSLPPSILDTASLPKFEDVEPSNEQGRPAASTASLPVLIPGPYAQADARERSQAAASARTETPSRKDTPQRPAERREIEIPVDPASFPPLGAVSSLAPREVARPAPTRKDPSATTGFLMVAAMLLIASAGWWLTAGTFSRASTSQGLPEQPSQPPQAPVAQIEPAKPAPSVAPESVLAPAETPPVTNAPLQPTAADKPSAPASSKPVKVASRSPRIKPAPVKPVIEPTGLPEAPTRAEVVSRLESVRSSVRACADGRTGVADLDITIAHSGVVTHVLVGGDFAGTTQGSCIARAVREARFPSFKQERFRLLFPYAI